MSAPGIVEWQDLRLIHASGKRALTAVEDCRAGDVLVASVDVLTSWECEVFDPRRLRETGAVSFVATDKGLIRKTARQVSGARLWNDKDVRAAFAQ